jgi:3-hydroxyisobutyrate dehydrogenase
LLVNAIKGGAAGSFSLDRYSSSIINGDYKPGFYVHHFVKDMGIALDECEKIGLELPGLKIVKSLY